MPITWGFRMGAKMSSTTQFFRPCHISRKSDHFEKSDNDDVMSAIIDFFMKMNVHVAKITRDTNCTCIISSLIKTGSLAFFYLL